MPYRFILLGIVVTVLFGLSLLTYRHPLTTWVWSTTRSPFLTQLLSPSDPTVTFTIAQYYFNHGTYDIARAKHYYQRTLALAPDSVPAHYQLGRIYFLQARYWLALKHMRLVLELDPEFEKGYYMLGLIHGYNGNLRQAIYGFEEFIKRDDFNWAGYNDLAWTYFQLGDFEKTLETAERGMARAYGNVWLLNMRGLALMNLNRTDEARQSFDQALERVKAMTPHDWGVAYPGNDPRIYAAGLERMREAIEHNVSLTHASS